MCHLLWRASWTVHCFRVSGHLFNRDFDVVGGGPGVATKPESGFPGVTCTGICNIKCIFQVSLPPPKPSLSVAEPFQALVY